MKASTKVWRTILGVIFILSGIAAIGKYSIGIVLACIVIGAVLIPWAAFKKAKVKAVGEPKIKTQADENAPAEMTPEEVAKNVAQLGQTCRYSYEHVGLYRPDGVGPMPPLGAVLLLEREEENPYDSNTIRAVQWKDGGVKVYGYMNKGNLRDMVSDFLDRSEPVMTTVTRADDKLEIWIGMP